MKPILIAGTIIVNFALISYSVAILSEQKSKIITQKILLFLNLGLLLDIIATSFMIAGSSNGAFTPHGIIGYTSLLGMVIDCTLIWRLKMKSGYNCNVPDGVHLYSRFAYIYWIIAYLTGIVLVVMR